MRHMNPTYLFYDIETTGLNKCFDQAIQFAAIRTDLDLNEIERFEYKIKLNPDVIPSPYAILTHNISIEQMQQGMTELEAIQQIHRLMNQPGTISVGYNTLGFDDEFLRFSFYRNLLSPYTHQFANGCGRMDIYPIAVLYYLFKNEALYWPKIDNKISLKLEGLNALNGLAQGDAHDAMVDVEVTLALAKKLKIHAEMWKYATGYFQKNEDLKRVNQLPIVFSNDQIGFRQAVMVYGKLGSKNKFQAPVLCLGQHQHYKNQTLWLKLDEQTLQATHANNIADNTYVIRKRAAEQQILLPPKERFLAHLSPERLALATENLQWLEANPTILQLICDYHQQFEYPKIDNIDADAALYDLPFTSRQEESIFTQFHHAEPKDKERIAQRITTPQRREQAIRILARHFPQHLSMSNQAEFQNYLTRLNQIQLNDFKGQKHYAPQIALQEIDTIIQEKNLNPQQIQLMKNYRQYLSDALTTHSL